VAVRSDLLASVQRKPQEHGMSVNLSRRKAVLLTGLFATSLLVAATAPACAQEPGLAIKGYDPVAYFSDGKPVRGAPEFEYTWDEHRWRFSSAEHLAQFKANPGAGLAQSVAHVFEIAWVEELGPKCLRVERRVEPAHCRNHARDVFSLVRLSIGRRQHDAAEARAFGATKVEMS
jgi:hypothetical protein